MILEEYAANTYRTHLLKRQPIAHSMFNKKQYWLGKEIVPKQYNNDEDKYLEIIKKLKQDSLSVDEALKMSGGI
jgi:hypothetical protein